MNAGKNRRGGFTLVEMLVVMAIIAILAGLITAAAANAMWAAKQTKIKVEVDMLAGAMESFKQKYGLYPPANLSCFKDGNGNFAANPQLLAFVSRAFPRYASVTAGYTIGNQIAYDLANAGVDVSSMAYNVNPQAALVLWLSGFGPDPTDPFNRANNNITRTSFFTFDQTRLVQAETNSSMGTTLGAAGAVSSNGNAYYLSGGTPTLWSTSAIPTYGIGQLVYNAPYGSAAYCYFDYQSYGTLINTSAGTIGNVAGVAAANFGTFYATSLSTVASPLTEYLSASTVVHPAISTGTGYVMPYVLDVNNNNTFDIADTFCSPTSFQIISAGQDGAFGTAVAPFSALQGRLYPSGQNAGNPAGTVGSSGISYDPPPPNGGSADDDNVTNFCAKSSLGSAKP